MICPTCQSEFAGRKNQKYCCGKCRPESTIVIRVTKKQAARILRNQRRASVQRIGCVGDRESRIFTETIRQAALWLRQRLEQQDSREVGMHVNTVNEDSGHALVCR